MKILINGSSGLIGTALVEFLQAQGYEVARLLRHPQDEHPYWDINTASFHLKNFSEPDIVINLAGENIGDGRWTKKRKQQLIDSRVITTSLLATHFKQKPPKLFINASAIGFYGETKRTLVNENSDAGKDFVSDLAKQWEASCDAVQSSQTRLVKLRTGIVMSKQGGALAKMLPAFKAGVGGKIGSGKQYMSWIDIEDVCRAIQFVIEHTNISGPVNLVSPSPETNKAFSIALSRQLNRPCIFPLPGIVVKLLFGEMGEALLLSSTRVKPSKLLEAGFQFKYPNLQGCLKERLK